MVTFAAVGVTASLLSLRGLHGGFHDPRGGGGRGEERDGELVGVFDAAHLLILVLDFGARDDVRHGVGEDVHQTLGVGEELRKGVRGAPAFIIFFFFA